MQVDFKHLCFVELPFISIVLYRLSVSWTEHSGQPQLSKITTIQTKEVPFIGKLLSNVEEHFLMVPLVFGKTFS
jgi:hypothetical protein